jgi:ASC-1-like (ASCH) protein
MGGDKSKKGAENSLKRNLLISALRERLNSNDFWRRLLDSDASYNLHVAVFREPYLRFILEGQKTIETRFSKNACAPYQKVAEGDVILLKRTGSAALGVCLVEKVWFHRVNATSLKAIRTKFGKAICAENSSFWDVRKSAVYATLILVGNVTPIQDLRIKKRDRRGWVVFPGARQQMLTFE